MIAILRLVVDFKSSTNSTTSAAASSRSPRLTAQSALDVMWIVNSCSASRYWAPSVATVIIIAQGRTMAASTVTPQPQPRSLIQVALRSQIHRAITLSATTISPTGPLISTPMARPIQKASLVQRLTVSPARWAA
ncbi:hypothetical protein D3C86_1871420 [compost metagenome]